jgi:hypothetical protein
VEKTDWDLATTALLLQIPIARARQMIEKLALGPDGSRRRTFPYPEDKATKEEKDEKTKS